MVVNYIILAHKAPEQLSRLVERLNTVNTFFYIHIDRNVDIGPFRYGLKDRSNVVFLPEEKRVKSVWGSFGVVKATLNAIREVIKDGRHGYTVLISGQCYPIKSNAYIHEFLEGKYGCNFIEGFELPDPRWPSSDVRLHQYAFFMSMKREDFITVPSFFELTFRSLFQRNMIRKYFKVILHNPLKLAALFKKRRFPKNLKPYGGMQWWALPLETLKFINSFLEANPEYEKYYTFTMFPDEIFFQTIVYNYFDEVSLPLTFALWPGEEAASSPVTFTTRHLAVLEKRKELFARKFDCQMDANVLDLIDAALLKKAL